MIHASILQDSVNQYGDRITSFELEYPRYIHAELMTHRVFSRNAASSRAIPIGKMIDLVGTQPAIPKWTANQAGMQGEFITDVRADNAQAIWLKARDQIIQCVQELDALGIHKQNANRLLEPFQHIKVVLTATDFNNFFALRCHKDAQPEIQELARKMQHAMHESTPMQLTRDEWHVPYVMRKRNNYGHIQYFLGDTQITAAQALKVSASCCAQVSYRVLDDSLSKALKIYDQLATSQPVHASPFEHQASPVTEPITELNDTRNFTGWVQHRVLIQGETVRG